MSVAVLGGGPAGLATALSLRRQRPDLSIAVLERSGYDRRRIGETLPPTVRPLLERLGAWPAFLADNHLPCRAAASAWDSDRLETKEFFDHPHNCGWHLDRRRFDATLARLAAKAGSRVISPARVHHCEPTPDGWRLTYQLADTPPRALETEFVVDATGRRSAFAQTRGVKRITADRLVGLVVFARFTGSAGRYDIGTLVETVPEGWWYSAGLPGGELVTAFMTDADIVRQSGLKTADRWLAAASRTRHVFPRLARAEPTAPPAVVPAKSFRLDRFGGDRWLAVGDAASTFDPVSSHGIFKSLRSGIMASYAIRDHFEGRGPWLEKYDHLHANEYAEYQKTCASIYRREQRWPTSPFWHRRAGE